MNYFQEQVFIGLQEVPNEISLIIPIAGCNHSCKGCHSPEYQKPYNGEPFTRRVYIQLLDKYKDKCSCVCFFGGEFQIEPLLDMARDYGYKTALYSGYTKVWDMPWGIMTKLDYLKLGHYDAKLGGLASKTTNQKMYEVTDEGFTDITSEFWR